MSRNVTLLIGLFLLPSLTGWAVAAQRSAADQALLQRALKTCNGPQYSSGARPVVNYSRGTFTCVEPGSSRR